MAGIIFVKRINVIQKYFLGFIVFSALVDLAIAELASRGIHTNLYFQWFLVIDFLYMSWLFHKSKSFLPWFKALFFLVLGFVVFNRGLTLVPSIEFGGGFWFFLILFLYYIIQSAYVVYREFDVEVARPFKNAILVIAFARLFYFLIIVFVYIYPDMVGGDYNNKMFWEVKSKTNAIGNTICNIAYAASFLIWNRIK